MGDHMLRKFCSLALAVGLTAALVGTTTAHAAADTSGPSLRVPAAASFILGQQVGDPIDDEGALWFADQGATMEYRWTATDRSGICRYSIDEEHGVEGWYRGVVNYRTNATTGRYTYFADEYFNSDDLGRIRFNAYDCAGNRTSVERDGSYIHLERDYGPTVPSGWARTSCTCAIGDSMLRTSTKQASLNTVVNAEGGTKHVALVMAKGPARGRASVYYDGTYVTTIDTYASANTNRIVMWEKELTGSADHTITVVNQATSGRPRIDIDAYVQSSL